MNSPKDSEISGLLNINKPKDLTSHDVVLILRRLLRIKKIGHTGTLDPKATGVLLICLGKATKLSSLLSSKEKEYIAKMRIGITTDTQDIWGNILRKERVERIEKEEILKIFDNFIGEISQIPPMYSAIRYKGKRLYQIARKGKEVERKPRKVTINFIKLMDYKKSFYPEVTFRVSCSSGTYIRTLCHDIGENLGFGACLSSLIRTKIDSYNIENSITLEELRRIIEEGRLLNYLIPLEKIKEELLCIS
jgi:tRNA pseudouridine55 synthase